MTTEAQLVGTVPNEYSSSPRSTQDERLLTTVERIVNDTDVLIAHVEGLKERFPSAENENEADHLSRLAREIVRDYATKSAIAGGITALPALLPGAGTLVAAIGGTLADVGLMLKHEVEMALCLSHLYGHDIRDEHERRRAYLLASVGTYEAKSGRNFFVDLAETEGQAVYKYGSHEVMRAVLLAAMRRLARLAAGRGFAKVVPVVGVIIGAAANRALTKSVGSRCARELAEHRAANPPSEEGLSIIDATVREPVADE